MTAKLYLFLAVAAVAIARPSRAQRAGSHADSLDGTWRGASLCTPAARPTCHDEIVVYHLRTLPPAPGDDQVPLGSRETRLEWVANKLVYGREEEMGVLVCVVDVASHTVSCPTRDWTWTFHVQRDAIHGTLASAAGVVWRNVDVRRAVKAGVR